MLTEGRTNVEACVWEWRNALWSGDIASTGLSRSILKYGPKSSTLVPRKVLNVGCSHFPCSNGSKGATGESRGPGSRSATAPPSVLCRRLPVARSGAAPKLSASPKSVHPPQGCPPASKHQEWPRLIFFHMQLSKTPHSVGKSCRCGWLQQPMTSGGRDAAAGESWL